MEAGQIVHAYANGDAELYCKCLDRMWGGAVPFQVPTSIQTISNLDRMIAPTHKGRWDLPGQKDTDETK